MTTVSSLIQSSTFRAAAGFFDLKPELSIVLPTFARGDNGLLKKAIDSLLNQRFSNFELIVVDDASIDSTAQLLDSYMNDDCRVAVIRHQTNIGLPGLSNYEAYLKSRGQKILTAYDDNIFTKDGIFDLMEDQRLNETHLITYGLCNLIWPDGKTTVIGEEDYEITKMRITGNYIGNSAVLLDRKVIETVGFYDPHIAIIRFFDWDLWLRAGKHFHFYKIKTCVFSEWGLTQKDSLGKLYTYSQSVIAEWVERYRDDELIPNKILDYHVDKVPAYFSFSSVTQVNDALAKRFGNKYEFTHYNYAEDAGNILLVASVTSSSIQLCFGVMQNRVTFVDINSFFKDPFAYIVGCKAVIFCREMFSPYMEAVIQALKAVRLPYYFYTDDNLFIIPDFEVLFTDKVFEFIREANGVLVTSEALREYVESNALNSSCTVLDCAPTYFQRQNHKLSVDHFDELNPLRIVYASIFKQDGFLKLKEFLTDFIQKRNCSVEIYAFSTPAIRQAFLEIFGESDNIRLFFIPHELDYDRFSSLLRNINAHFIIHTASTQWAEIYKYKTFNFFITAWYANAIPIITVRPPYDGLVDDPLVGKFIVEDGSKVFQRIEDFLSGGPELAATCLRDIDAFVAQRLPEKRNIEIINDLLKAKPCSYTDMLESLETVSPCCRSDIGSSYVDVNHADDVNHAIVENKRCLLGTVVVYTVRKPLSLIIRILTKCRNLLAEF